MPRRRPFLAVAPILALAVVASACGAGGTSPDPSDAPQSEAPASLPASVAPSVAPSAVPSEGAGAPVAGTDLDACEIVTAADIESAVALDVGTVADGELTEDPTTLSPGHTSCRYAGDWGGVTVSLTPEDGENLYDAARGSYDEASDRVVTGADGAFWSDNDGRGFFWKGAATVMLQIGFLADGGDRDAIVTALGQAAMDRVD